MGYDEECWTKANVKDLWIFDKLILARKLGYSCGPKGIPVPKPNKYIVRPCINLLGMGQGAEIIYLNQDTKNIKDGHFWSEYFSGRHLSIDYKDGKQVLCVEGIKNGVKKFNNWIKVEDKIPYPKVLKDLVGNYSWVNVEFIGNNIIEVHLRKNPDFIGHTSNYARPVWKGVSSKKNSNEIFINRPDANRLGFYIEKGTLCK